MTAEEELRTAAKLTRETAEADRLAEPLAALLEHEAEEARMNANRPPRHRHDSTYALAVARVINRTT